MLDKRLPMLCAFAGGCLSTALFFANWRPAPVVVRSAPATPALERTDDAGPSEDAPAPTATPTRRPERDPNAESATAKNPDAPEASAEQGRSVADVLTHLEAAYRKGLAPAPDGTPSKAESTVASVPEDVAAPRAERAPSAPAADVLPPVTPPTTAVPDAAPREVAAQAVLAAPVAVMRSGVPVSAAPVAAAPAEAPLVGATDADTSPLPAEVAQGLAERNVGQPRDVYLGNVQNNVYEGPVYQAPVYEEQQQLAMLEYMQLLSGSSYGRVGRRAPRGFAARSVPMSRPLSASRPSILPAPAPNGTFTSDLTNPDNPWGFDFPPTMLVK